jgi:hypothetical protein
MLSQSRLFPATQSVDLYSVSGLRGTDYKGVPYFPRKLALQILQNAILLHGKYRVPSARDHFHSLAFHAVYHKGESSGLPISRTQPATAANADHDYVAVLKQLRRQVRERADVTLQGLDRYLSNKGLRPPGDLLERYQTRNPWLQRKLASERPDIGPAAGLVTFVVRDRAIGNLADAVSAIEKHGFELLHVFHLTDEERARVSERVRGGNWSCGPFPQSGGGPAAIIVAYDFSYQPDAASDGQLVNANAASTKATIRELIHSRLDRSERFNPLHSTDNGWQSLECLKAVDRDGLIADVRRQVCEIDGDLKLPWPVTRELSLSGRRARVLLVEHPVHGQVVAKIFRRGARRFFERELQARQELAGLPCVPKLLDHGDNWILTPLYSNTSAHVVRDLRGCLEAQLTFDAMAVLARFVHALRERDYFLLDLSTHNLISDPEAGLLMLDFEFLQRYPIPTPRLYRDYTVLGEAAHPSCDAPVYRGRRPRFVSVHKSVFHPAVCGLAPNEFLLPPTLRLRAKMAFFQASWWIAFAIKGPLQAAAERRSVRAAIRLLAQARRFSLPSKWSALRLPVPDLRRLQLP